MQAESVCRNPQDGARTRPLPVASLSICVDRENIENCIRDQRVPNFDMHIVLRR